MKVFAIFFTILFAFSSIFFAQSTQRKKPTIKDFGSSLKIKSPENLNQKKTSQNNGVNHDVIKIETNLVLFDFLVLDKKGNAVHGLKKEDFIIYEDNKPQQIEAFSLGDDVTIPRSIVLIIDYSGSQLPYIERSIEAAKLLVDKLRPNDLMAIVTDDVELLVQFTPDKNLLKEKLESLRQNALSYKTGKSQQFSSLYAVLNEMFDEEDIRPIVIFQTDGDQIGSLKGGYMDLSELKNLPPFSIPKTISITNFSFNNLLTLIEKKRSTIYTVVPGYKMIGLSLEERIEKRKIDLEIRQQFFNDNPPRIETPPSFTPQEREEIRNYSRLTGERIRQIYPNGLPNNQEILAGLSKWSGGWIDFLEQPNQANDIYNRILSDINTRYLLSYYPTNEAKDGKRRVIKVEVKNRKNLVVWGRKTYIAPSAD